MNCEQFRANLNSLLDTRSSILLTDEMKQHIETCTDCRQYESSILLLHEELLRILLLKPSKAFLKQLHSISSEQSISSHSISWKPEIQLAAILTVPAIIAILSRWLFNGIGIIVQIGVMTIGLSLLISLLMKPAILGKYSELTSSP